MRPLTAEEIARRVAESRAAQGLPRHVEDPVVLADVAALVTPRLDKHEPTVRQTAA